jgi:hypothetical protein
MTSGEMCELYAAHGILFRTFDYLTEEHKTNIDALLMILDARVLIQETIVSELFSQGDGYRC